MYDCIIAGCGFAGAACARVLAEGGKKVLVVEKRAHIAGNMYDCPDEHGILIHRYGPHIFHTSNTDVFAFLSRFSAFFPYEHRVLGKIDGSLVPIPFNFRSFDLLWDAKSAKNIESRLAAAFPGRAQVSVLDLLGSSDPDIRRAGQFVYKNVFENYTAKQWGTVPSRVDPSVINRVPVRLGYDDRYFSDPIQYMPSKGFTALFEKMLNHPNIKVELNTDALRRLSADPDIGRLLWDGEPFERTLIYTGPVDELFGCRYGRLPYRSLDLAFEHINKTHFQPASVVNYPNEEAFTRITEFKYLTGQKKDGSTTILREYPLDYDADSQRGNIPYYPVMNQRSLALYEKYAALASRFGNLFLCGRLADYRYYNMDAAVAAAVSLAGKLI
jgi:UDP-galactopyranose mutase